MKKSIFSIVVVAFLAMSSAFNLDNIDMLTGVDQDYMIGLCTLLTHQGYITEITKEECNQKNIVELIDLGINANELAKQRDPQTASDRDVNIAFLKNARRKWISASPKLETESTQTNVGSNSHHGITTFAATSSFSNYGNDEPSSPLNEPTGSYGQFVDQAPNSVDQPKTETLKSDRSSEDKSSEENSSSFVNQGNEAQRPNEQEGEFTQDINSAPSSHTSSSSNGLNNDPSQSVPESSFQDYSQGSGSPSQISANEVIDRQPEVVPQNVPQAIPESTIQEPQGSESNPSSQAWVSANDGLPADSLIDKDEDSNSQWQDRPAPVQNPEMNPANFIPIPNERPSGRPEYPQQQHPPQQQYPQNYYPQQHQTGAYPAAQQYPTQPQRRPSGGGLLSTLAKFVGKIF